MLPPHANSTWSQQSIGIYNDSATELKASVWDAISMKAKIWRQRIRYRTKDYKTKNTAWLIKNDWFGWDAKNYIQLEILLRLIIPRGGGGGRVPLHFRLYPLVQESMDRERYGQCGTMPVFPRSEESISDYHYVLNQGERAQRSFRPSYAYRLRQRSSPSTVKLERPALLSIAS